MYGQESMNHSSTKSKLYCDCAVVDKLSRIFVRRSQKYRAGDAFDDHKEGVFRYFAEPSDSWVTVHNLKSLSDGGILDPDDRLNDVADDREQIVAIYEEQGTPYLPHNGGDGTSASSVGTDSPVLFHSEDSKSDTQIPCHTDVEIIGDSLPSGISCLQVRRGSEPALNRLSPISSFHLDSMKRWSTAVVLDDRGLNGSHSEQITLNDASDSDVGSEREDGSGEEKSTFAIFSRDSGRLSILGTTPDVYRWVDAADRQIQKFKDGRREPVGGSNVPKYEHGQHLDILDRTHSIVLKNDGGPLGIHVVPEYDDRGWGFGLAVQGIEPGGKIDQDGRINVGDRITEINGNSLIHVPFHRAQDIFRDALQISEVCLKLIKASGDNANKPPAPVYPRLEAPNRREGESDSGWLESDDKYITGRVATVSPTKMTPAASLTRNTTATLASNTRKIGKKYPIQLVKGPNGLGFSITTRDNLAGGNCPIYIKNILTKGAAIEDGRLKAGDRLLEVNGIEMTGKTQDEAVAILRNAPPGSTVNLVVSRQELESPRFPRQIMGSDRYPDCGESPYLQVPAVRAPQPPERTNDDGFVFPWKHREIITFDIPLNDTGSAGLGVSVKGKTSTGPQGTVDLGIFIKSVIHGGAASKDGRLRENDQLVNINGVSLLKMSNSQAMETLRRVMHQEGPNPGAITLTIARRVSSQGDKSSSIKQDFTNSSSIHHVSSNSLELPSNGRVQTPTSDASATSTSDSDRTAVFRPYPYSGNSAKVGNSPEEEHNLNSESITKIEDKDLGLDCPGHMRNPIIERITGQKAPRNDSFHQACHDKPGEISNWNSPQLKQYRNAQVPLLLPPPHPLPPPPPPLHGSMGMSAPTINASLDDSVMIDNDYIALAHPSMKGKCQSRSATPDNFLSSSPPSDVGSNNPSVALQGDCMDQNFTYASQISLDENGVNFARDGFGRQSMSEKRNAQLDARNTDTWQRNKKVREEKEKQKQQPHYNQDDNRNDTNDSVSNQNTDIPPRGQNHDLQTNLMRSNSADSLVSTVKAQRISSVDMNMKKSNSLESLPTDGQANDDVYGQQPNRAGVRGRGCNESFRAAVDRSYDAPVGTGETMETVDEESESGSSANIGSGGIRQSSNVGEDMRLGKKGKKKGLLKNLGSVFKFGRAKKEPNLNLKNGVLESEHYTKIDPEMNSRKVCDDDQDRLRDRHTNIPDWSKSEQDHLHKRAQHQSSLPVPPSINSNISYQNGPSAWASGADFVPSKQERMTHLRAQHQKKHKERSGQYPQDSQEEKLQQRAQDKIDRRFVPRDELLYHGARHSCRGYNYEQRYESEVMHSRSHSYDLYQERPRATDLGDTKTNKYSHYMNYEEIQQHMRSQNSRPPVPPGHRERPVSNFFEYESIQGATKPTIINVSVNSALPSSKPENKRAFIVKQSKVAPQNGCERPLTTVSNGQGSFRAYLRDQNTPSNNSSISSSNNNNKNSNNNNNNQRLYEPFNKSAALRQRPSGGQHHIGGVVNYMQKPPVRDATITGSKV